jgi:hypothetical protein
MVAILKLTPMTLRFYEWLAELCCELHWELTPISITIKSIIKTIKDCRDSLSLSWSTQDNNNEQYQYKGRQFQFIYEYVMLYRRV